MTCLKTAAIGPSAKPPLVSLVILGFNQERFVDAAIEGALSQTYHPLEIILSDDCSSDRTADLMQQAANRSSRHQVIFRRSDRNEGVLQHLIAAARIAQGELIVVAAADDICCPQRVARTVEHWRRTGAAGLFAKYDVIDDKGEIIQRDYRFGQEQLPNRAWFRDATIEAIHGASSAYARDVLLSIPPLPEPVLFEDTFLTLWLISHGLEIHYIDEVLVHYRRHDNSITNAEPSQEGFSDFAYQEKAGRQRDAKFLLNLTTKQQHCPRSDRLSATRP